MKTALLINSGFALRQVNGLPVYTEERMFDRLNSKEEIKRAIDEMKKHKKGKLLLIKNERGKKSS